MREHTMPRCPYVTLVTYPTAMHDGSGRYLAPDMSFRQREPISFWNVSVGMFPRNFRSPKHKLPYPADQEPRPCGSYFCRVTTFRPSVIVPRSTHLLVSFSRTNVSSSSAI